MSDKRPIKQGDQVLLTDVHHAMNQHLKEKEGEVGTVIDDGRGWERELYVEFGDSNDSRFKICRTRVEVVTRD
jgi:hypothetical protein